MGSLLSFIPGVGQAKWIGIGLATIGVVTTVYLGYHHYTSVVEENKTLTTQVSQLTTAIDLQKQLITEQKAAIADWMSALAKYRDAVADYAKVQQQASAQKRRLQDVQGKHDFAKDAAARPEAVEQLLNRGTSDAWSMFRCASGATGAGCPNGGAAPSGAPASAAPGAGPPSAR